MYPLCKAVHFPNRKGLLLALGVARHRRGNEVFDIVDTLRIEKLKVIDQIPNSGFSMDKEDWIEYFRGSRFVEMLRFVASKLESDIELSKIFISLHDHGMYFHPEAKYDMLLDEL